MQSLIVHHVVPEERAFVLRDGEGRLHRARVAAGIPPLGDELWGVVMPGPVMLFSTVDDRIYWAYFEPPPAKAPESRESGKGDEPDPGTGHNG